MNSMTVDKDVIKKYKWQEIGDSPTTKYYTDWNQYEKVLNKEGEIKYEKPLGNFDIIAGPCGNAKKGYEAKLLRKDEGKLSASHFYHLKEISEISLDSGEYKISLCNPIGESWASQHLIVNIEENADVSLIIQEERNAPGTTAIEIILEKNSKSNVSILLNPNIKYPTAYLIRKALYKESKMNSLTFSTPTIMNRIEEKVVLFEDSKLLHKSLTFSYSNSRVDNIIDTIQAGKNSDSDVYGLGFAFDSSLSSVRGTDIITYDAKKSKSNFVVEALILGNAAKAYTMPMMKIETGDVISATHKSAQYRLNEDILFYLESRGLSYDEIISLIVYEKSLNMASHLEKINNYSQEYIKNILNNLPLIQRKSN